MHSIFLGNDVIKRVYTREIIDTLKQEAGLEETIYKKDDLLTDPEKFSDVDNIFTSWGMPSFTEEEIKTCLPNLKGIYYGAGTVQYFARPFLNLGVRIFSAWGANAVPVAEVTVAEIVLANKGFYQAAGMFKSPEGRHQAAQYQAQFPGNFDCCVGIIGAGMIGKMVISRLHDYRLKVKVYDPFLSDEKAKELGVEKTALNDLFATCQTISNHVANLPETVGMMSYEQFSLMKKNATFINTGRGAQIVEADLIRALKEEPERTAVLDVTMPEPPEEGSEFYTLPNVILSPHLAGSSGLEVERMGEYMLDQFRAWADNRPCVYEVSLKMLETMA